MTSWVSFRIDDAKLRQFRRPLSASVRLCPFPSGFVRIFLANVEKKLYLCRRKENTTEVKVEVKKHAGFTPYLTPIFTPSKRLKLFIPVKSFYKYELANAAGVSDRTFRRWLSENTEPLSRLGVKPTTKMLPPRAVEWICREYGIDCPIA